MNGDALYDLGGVSLQLWQVMKFFPVAFLKLVQEWHKYWFYASGLEGDLPAFVNEPQKKLGSWAPVDHLSKGAQELA